MFLVSIYRLTKFALQNFWRNFWLSIVTITIIILSLFSVNTLIGLNAISHSILNSISEKVDIAVYFKSTAPEEIVLVTREVINKFEAVKEIELISADQALETFKAKHQGDPLVNEALAELDVNPLGSILLVQAKDINSYNQLYNQIKSLDLGELVEDIDFQDRSALINRLKNITQKTTLAITIISSVFIIISILVVFNTIRLGLYAHQEEIGIMKLVGASNWYIRMPFLIEGFLYALLSTVVFWLILFALISWLDPIFVKFFSEVDFSIKNFFITNFISLFWQELLILTLINITSAVIATRKYLKV